MKCKLCGKEHPSLDLFRRWQRRQTMWIDETEMLMASQEAAKCAREAKKRERT